MILAACGIYISVEDTIVNIFTSFESWLRVNYGDNASVMLTWNDILTGATAGTIVGMKTFIPIFKKYLNTELTGYGTGASDLIIGGKSIIREPFYLLADKAATKGCVYDYSLKYKNGEFINFYDFYIETGFDTSYLVFIRTYSYGTYDFALMFYNSSTDSLVSKTPRYGGYIYNTLDDTTVYNTSLNVFSVKFSPDIYFNILAMLPYPVYENKTFALSHFRNGTTDGLITVDGTAIVADKTWSGLQTKDDATNITYGDNLTVPDTDEALQRILDALGIANTSKEVADALAPSLTITETGESGGESGGDTSILGVLGSILSAVLALPVKIVSETVDAISDVPLFNGISLNLDSITSGIGDVLTRISQWDFSDWTVALGATLLATLTKAFSAIGLDGIGDVLSRIIQWDFSDWTVALGATLLATLTKASSDIGLDEIGDVLLRIAQWDFSDWANALGASFLLALLEFSSRIGLDGVAETLVNIRDGVLSIPDILSNLYEFVKTIPVAIATALASLLSFEPSEEPNDKGFKNFLNIFMLLLFIVIMLIILFINCLRFIVLVFNIPSSTVLFNEDVLSGIEFLKSIEIPLFGMSVYALLLSVAYFVLFFSIIAMLRKKIDKFNL